MKLPQVFEMIAEVLDACGLASESFEHLDRTSLYTTMYRGFAGGFADHRNQLQKGPFCRG
jgi:hypothetical protein